MTLLKPVLPLKLIATALMLGATASLSSLAAADIDKAAAMQAKAGVAATYDRVLPLEGGSNFRDLGGYKTADGKEVRKGMLFRSAAMTNFTEADQQYLAGFVFDTVVDLRSTEERDLFPDRWLQNSKVHYVATDYSIVAMMAASRNAANQKQAFDMATAYQTMHTGIKQQLSDYFDNAIKGNAPIVVHCSAGQDRTGIASALMLSALGVPRAQVVQDYVLTPAFRRPDVEMAGVDLQKAAETNAFAKMIAHHFSKEIKTVPPVFTNDGVPFINFALNQIEKDYGSVEQYLDKELDVSAADIAQLRKLYLN
ncbi:tyrosine-protein phosphatase [Oceanobacter mangrovi]|uniref:tyrosine-protein phosphatase n=1 Tax=Oceanobacter mangrovi TaxID=2862510 RepID=UPI001C8EB805|nr:tyrosine-protein phosphatase [Oceanobacter mangrovi]